MYLRKRTNRHLYGNHPQRASSPSNSHAEVQIFLNDNRFVDDLGVSHHDHQVLVEQVEEYIRICSEY